MNYIQCTLQNNTSHLVSWIPEKYAKTNSILKLKNGDLWEDGWKVMSVGTKLDESLVPDTHKAIKQHWKNTSGNVPIGHK